MNAFAWFGAFLAASLIVWLGIMVNVGTPTADSSGDQGHHGGHH